MWQFRIPGLFRTVVRDTTHYFLVIFTSHLALELTLIFGTVRIISYFLPHLLTETAIALNPSTPRIVSDNRTPLPLIPFTRLCAEQWKRCVRRDISFLLERLDLNPAQISSGDDRAVNALVEESLCYPRGYMEFQGSK